MSKINGFAQDTCLFAFHTGFMKFLTWLVYDIHLQLYDKAKDTIVNMARANYFYIIAYPVYSGCRIEQDPVFTAYINPQAIPEFPASLILPVFMTTAFFIILCARKRQLSKARNHFQP
jgi:hypothetical protein